MPALSIDIQHLSRALAAANDLIYDWDLVTDAVTWVGDAQAALGLGPDLLPTSIDAFKGRINPQDLPNRMLALSDHLSLGKEYDSEYRVRQGDGSFCWVHDRGCATFDQDGTPLRFTGVLRVIDKRKQHEARLEMLANYDELTGFYNRKRLRQSLEELLEQARRYEQPGAYLCVGVDNLAALHEAYGYSIVDAIIVAAGQRLEGILRAADIIGRTASDGFGVIITRCADDEALESIKEKVLTSFREVPLSIGNSSIPVTVSVGAVAYGAHPGTATDCMAKADLALQRARLRGQDRAESYVWAEASSRNSRVNREICESVMAALQDERMQFAYQPIVKAATGRVAFYEGLMRMRTPAGEIVPAGQFMPAVEALGLHRMIDRQALDLAIAELQSFPDLRMAINVSSLTMSDRAWLRRLVSKLRYRRSLAERLIVEVTETAAMQDMEESVRFVSHVRDLGCGVAIDDFGAGYTSFRQLRTLTVDLLKIDGSYIRDLVNSESNQLFVRTLLDLASGFDLETVAEFIETPAEAQLLRELGVTYLQGFHVGRPDLQRPWTIETQSDRICEAG